MGTLARLRAYTAAGGPSASIVARVAATPEDRAAGFAGRTALAPGEAMLFAFPEDTTTPFTLAKTGVALDVVFLDAAGLVLAVRTVAAYSPLQAVPPRPYRYALEVAAGTMARWGVGPGGAVIADAVFTDGHDRR